MRLSQYCFYVEPYRFRNDVSLCHTVSVCDGQQYLLTSLALKWFYSYIRQRERMFERCRSHPNHKKQHLDLKPEDDTEDQFSSSYQHLPERHPSWMTTSYSMQLCLHSTLVSVFN